MSQEWDQPLLSPGVVRANAGLECSVWPACSLGGACCPGFYLLVRFQFVLRGQVSNCWFNSFSSSRFLQVLYFFLSQFCCYILLPNCLFSPRLSVVIGTKSFIIFWLFKMSAVSVALIFFPTPDTVYTFCIFLWPFQNDQHLILSLLFTVDF